MRLGKEVCENPTDNEDARDPDQIVDKQRNEAAADAGDGHLDRDELRGFNAKLI